MLNLLAEMDLAQRVWLFSGKLHPVVVHFPIALLIVGVTLEFARLRRGVLRPSSSARVCIVLGAVAAIAAAAMGWSGATTAGHQETVLWPHRWLGIATAGLAACTAIFALLSNWRGTYRLFNAYRVCAVVGAGLVGLTGHFGGSLVYGPDYVENALALLKQPSKDTSPKRTALSDGAAGAIVEVKSADQRSFSTDDVRVDFVRDVRPIFARRCLSCHSGSEAASELDLDDHANVLKGGESGEPALVAGDAKKSRIIRLIMGQEKGMNMPPKGGPLDADQIATITRWIDQGAKWTDAHENNEHWHWAYRLAKRPTLPAVKDTYWPRTPIDFFVLSRLERESMKPSPEADRVTLIQRLSLDVIGLPPTLAEVDAFVGDRSADAYEKVVDRLLASPHYGERWAQVWLDLARYADTHGYEKDQRRVMWPYRDWVIDAFNRDLPFDEFTVEQLAGDLLPDPSLDQLVATGFHRNTMINEEGGVDLEEFRSDAVIDRVSTTASVWLGATVGCAQCHDHKYDPISQRDYFKFFAFLNQDVADSVKIAPTESRAAGGMVSVPSRANLAEFERLLKQVSAAESELRQASDAEKLAQDAWEKTVLVQSRTQDGEQDGVKGGGEVGAEGGVSTLPISTSTSTAPSTSGTSGTSAVILVSGDLPPARPVPADVLEAIRVASTDRTLAQHELIALFYSGVAPSLKSPRDRVASLKKEVESKTVAKAMVMKSLPGGRETHVFQRGSFLSPGERVEAGVPSVLVPVAGDAGAPDRLGLARWIVDLKNPLTARVQVNRIWARVFGRGIVETEDDFGTQGDPPTHPELLDWLATEFVRDGWSQKSLLREMLTSAAYRQSSNLTPELLEKDPHNRLLARAPRYRVEAEMVRDVALAASGLLVSHVGGPSVFPPQPPGVWTMIYSDDTWEESHGADRYRRGLYTFWRRTAPYPMFAGFDAPSREISCTRRARTNTPLQALSTLNDPQFMEAARALAVRMMDGRMMDGKNSTPECAIERGFRLCVGRVPTPTESERLVRLFREQVSSFKDDRSAAARMNGASGISDPEFAAWQVVANVLLNLDEALTRP